MRKISNNTMIAGALIATMGTTSVFAMDNEFRDGYYFGGSLGKAVSRTKPSGSNIDILQKATIIPNAGATFKVDYKNADSFGLLGGYKMGDIRYEADFKHSKHKLGRLNEHLANGTVQDFSDFVEEVSIQYKNIAFSAYRDFKGDSSIIPYAGAGVGIGRFKSRAKFIGPLNSPATISNTKLTGQLVGGVRLPITSGFHLSADYRYFSTIGKVGAIDKRFSNHSINLGFLFQPRFL